MIGISMRIDNLTKALVLADNNKTLYKVLNCIDIMAMFMILFYHSAHYILSITGHMGTMMYELTAFFVAFGLTGFAYSSGFKLFLNHYNDFENKEFCTQYIIQRTAHLYRLYLTYPFGCLVFLYGLYYILGITGGQAAILTYFNMIAPINVSAIIKYLFYGMPPVAGHLWFIFVLMVIYIIVLGAMRLFGVRLVLMGLFPLLLMYFEIHFHILSPISPEELQYFVCLYMTIFLSGALMGYLYNKNRKIFHAALFGLSGMFMLVMAGYVIYTVIKLPLPHNHYFMLLYRNELFKYGLTFPGCFMMVLILLKDTKIVSYLSGYRQYILPIYFLQYPFTIPFYSNLLSKIGFYNLQISWLAPLMVTLLSIPTCIILYKAYKRIHSWIFEKK